MRKMSHDEAVEICVENMLNAIKLLSKTMLEVGRNLIEDLQYHRNQDMFQKFNYALKEVGGITYNVMDIVSLKLTNHSNKVASFLFLILIKDYSE